MCGCAAASDHTRRPRKRVLKALERRITRDSKNYLCRDSRVQKGREKVYLEVNERGGKVKLEKCQEVGSIEKKGGLSGNGCCHFVRAAPRPLRGCSAEPHAPGLPSRPFLGTTHLIGLTGRAHLDIYLPSHTEPSTFFAQDSHLLRNSHSE